VVAVGTTAVRSLESAAVQGDEGSPLAPYSGDTDIFLYPGCRFRVVDAMVTNFHLPESTLIMLVSAFAGVDTIRAPIVRRSTTVTDFSAMGMPCS